MDPVEELVQTKCAEYRQRFSNLYAVLKNIMSQSSDYAADSPQDVQSLADKEEELKELESQLSLPGTAESLAELGQRSRDAFLSLGGTIQNMLHNRYDAHLEHARRLRKEYAHVHGVDCLDRVITQAEAMLKELVGQA
jgi:hypothetical protein